MPDATNTSGQQSDAGTNAGQQQAGAGTAQATVQTQAGAGTAQAATQTQATNQAAPITTYEELVASLSPEHKALIEASTRGLRTALDSERQTTKLLEKLEAKLKRTATALGRDTPERDKLDALIEQLGTELQTATRRSSFSEAAHAANVNDIRLAFLAAEADGLFDATGRVDFVKLKEIHPQLFNAPPQTQTQARPASANAGAGTAGQAAPPPSMNELIRAAAGRRRGS